MKTLSAFGYKFTIKKDRTPHDRVDTRAIGKEVISARGRTTALLRQEIQQRQIRR